MVGSVALGHVARSPAWQRMWPGTVAHLMVTGKQRWEQVLVSPARPHLQGPNSLGTKPPTPLGEVQGPRLGQP